MASENESVRQSENETVAEIREDVHEYLTSIGPDETQFEEFADRFVEAHKREVAELKRQREEALTIASDIDKCARIERYTNAMLKKNKVIADLRKEVAELRRGIAELLDTLQSIYDEECCRTDEVYDKWRKFMEGANG